MEYRFYSYSCLGKKIFPDISEKEAMDKLWELIFKCSRVTEDPIQAWKEHNNNLKEKQIS